ncbi:MAG: SMP-30/gluconolactonase/LRE family protein, partial [Bryobacteraceae bacterium]
MNRIRRIAGCSMCLWSLASASDLFTPLPAGRAALENAAPATALRSIAKRTADSPRSPVITTFAGTDWIFQSDGKPALEAPLSQLEQMTIDPDGNVVGADPNNGIVFRLNRDGSLTVLAGNGIRGFSGDGGPAVSASLSLPRSVAYDHAGNLYIADQVNHRIRRVSTDGVISTFAGTGRAGNTGDQGPATQAALNAPDGVAADSAGNVYILDFGNFRIRRVTRDGVIATFAGTGQAGFSRETGPATAFPMRPRRGLAADAAGNVFIADFDNHQVRKVTPEGEISTVAGTGMPGRSGDGGPATAAMLASPAGLALDAEGNLFVADLANHRIRKISTDRTISTVAGRGVREYSGDNGPAGEAGLSAPIGVAVDRAGNLFVADTGNYRVRKIDLAANITTVAGNGSFRNAPPGTLAENAYLAQPQGLAFDPGGNLLVSDTANFRIRRILADRTVETIAGSGLAGCCAEGGPALEDLLTFPSFLVADPQGNIYFSDSTAARIRRLSSAGFITTYAGTGVFGYRDGPAREALLGQPFGLALDGSGNLFFADSANHVIRNVSPDGQVTTIAGNRQAGFSGDGPALSVTLNAPNGLAFDNAGNLLIADTLNHRVRILSPGGNLTTMAGTGVASGPLGDGGPATQASLNAPIALAIDATGNVYVAEFGGSRVRRISPDGVITTVAGTGQRGFSGDGKPATEAALSFPSDLAIDREGNLYIADAGNNRIRRVLASPPEFETAPASLSFSARAGGAPPPPQRFTILSSITGVAFTATATTVVGGDWLKLSAATGETPRLIEVAADPSTLQPGYYEGSITITLPDATPSKQRFPVVFNVGPGLGPQIFVDRKSLSFPLPRGASARSQIVTIANPGGGTLNFRAAAATTSGGRWLSVSAASGEVVPAKPSILNVTANPQGLAPGTYSGTLSISGTGAAALTIPVHLLVSANDRAVRLSQSGLT